jgi:hypothetical protein
MTVLWVIGGILLTSLPLALSVWALLDAARRPEWAFALAGHSRLLWVALCGGGILFCAVGVIVAIIYLVRIRPQVAAAEAGRIV